MSCKAESAGRRRAMARRVALGFALLAALGPTPRAAAADRIVLPASEVLMSACAEELARAATLHIEELDKPYFVQFIVNDAKVCQMSAAYGALRTSNENRLRTFAVDVRAGDFKLDSSNFAGGGGPAGGLRRGGGGGAGGGTSGALPLDDQPLAIRQALWIAADEGYKRAVEALTQKRAYLKEIQAADRPDDFTPASPTTAAAPPAAMTFDMAAWERNVQQLSARFKQHPDIQDSSVQLTARWNNTYILNTEGTRVRKGETAVVLTVTAQGQAADGMRLADRVSWAVPTAAELPSLDAINAAVDRMAAGLQAAMKAPVLDNYTGPVLFSQEASAHLFRTLLAPGIVGRPEPLGTRRRGGAGGTDGLERQLGLTVLPKSFQVFDDPTLPALGGVPLIGHYRYDDEGVPAQRVDLVVNGVLKNLCLSRTPTRKLTGSNGHGRQFGGGAPRAAIGSLIIQDSNGLPEAELRQKLIDAAREAGLEFGVRVASLESGGGGRGAARFFRGGGGGAFRGRGGDAPGGGGPGDPVLLFKVFVSDGHEEPVRGCEFGSFEIKNLKDIIAAGDTPFIQNVAEGATVATIAAPAVLFEELELVAIDQENDKLPILKPPAQR